MPREMFEFTRDLTTKPIFDAFPKPDKKIINDFQDYLRITASEKRTEEGIREIIRFREVVGKPLNQINIKDLHYFLKELKQYPFADYTKNKIKDFVKRFLRWYYKDWSSRFNEFYDIKTNTDAQRKKEITDKEILKEKDVMKLLDAEPSLFWKTFLITQYEGALRTGEVRNLTWEMVDFGDDDFTTLNIPSKKNKNGTIKKNPVVVKVSGRFLKELKREQDKREIKTLFVFPSPNNPNKPISKAVNLWFNQLCKRVLGRNANNYLLRHGKGTELQEKVRKGILSKDNAVEFMRHSEKMFDKTYSHMSKEDIKALMKKQIYNVEELTEDERTKLEKRIEAIEKDNEELRQFSKEGIKQILDLINKKSIIELEEEFGIVNKLPKPEKFISKK